MNAEKTVRGLIGPSRAGERQAPSTLGIDRG